MIQRFSLGIQIFGNNFSKWFLFLYSVVCELKFTNIFSNGISFMALGLTFYSIKCEYIYVFCKTFWLLLLSKKFIFKFIILSFWNSDNDFLSSMSERLTCELDPRSIQYERASGSWARCSFYSMNRKQSIGLFLVKDFLFRSIIRIFKLFNKFTLIPWAG